MRRALAFAAFTALATAGAASAATVGGVTLGPTLEVAGRTLELASCGVRDTMWIDHYAAGLYLPKGKSAKAAADDDTASAVRLKIIQAQYLPDNIPAKWRGALDRELEREPMVRVRRAYDRLQDGDVVTFAYVPSRGVTMQLNGEPPINVGDHAVIGDILAAWSESDPIGNKLRRLELEHPC